MTCGSCKYNDGCVYTSLPPRFKCTITGEFHFGNDDCDVDFEPVKRGKWKHIPEEPFAGIYVCSVYNKQAEVNSFEEWLLTDYCPFCGAKMILNDENNIDEIST